jgi:quinohemoprotein ethanol dehydrogenase
MTPFFRALRLALARALTPAPAIAQQPPIVDDAALTRGAAGEWLTHGQSYAETRYVALDRIDASNVHRLDLAWTMDMPGTPGRVQATPLISNGVMYLTGPLNVVYALDARSGATKWTWNPALPAPGLDGGPRVGVNRGVALYRGKVYVGLADGRLVALDAETGQPVWSRQTTPYGVTEYNITGAPRVVSGKVVIGNGGAEYHGVRGYVTAYDAETGDFAWRFHTVPGDPSRPFESPAMEYAARTWSGEWWKFGGGGTAWDSFSYDPDANLLYVGTGNGAPWNHFWRSEGVGDNLFLNSILALDADSGELVWYYQTTPGDSWDYTSTMTMTLTELVIDGRERRVLMQAPKNGFFYVLDRLTGELLSAEPITEHITWASGVDLRTGRPIENPRARYDTAGVWLSPGTGGAHNWHPMSWNPNTGLVYIPGQNLVNFWRLDPNFTPVLGEFSTGTIRGGEPTVEPPPPPGPPGFLLAWDPVKGEERWRVPMDVQRNGGTLSTAGNLVFSGRVDGWILAHDARTGEELWKYRLGPNFASPISYELDGRQYVVVATGPIDGRSAARVWAFTLVGDEGTAPARD